MEIQGVKLKIIYNVLKNDYGDVNETELRQEWEQWLEHGEHFSPIQLETS